MNIKRILLLSLTLFLLTAATVFAQHGAVGGGLMAESDMQTYIGRLDDFLETAEGQEAFPEIRIHDLQNSESFHSILLATRPVLKPGTQFDQFGTPRSCVGYHENSQRYFVCNQNDFVLTLENQPKIYKLILHELFVQAGIEVPHGANIPSEYAISNRILKHLFKDDSWGWLPGSLPKDPITQSGLWCTDQPSIGQEDIGPGLNVRLLFWSATGEVQFVQIKNNQLYPLFAGSAPLPQNCDQSTIPFLQGDMGYKYAPLHALNQSSGAELWLATNENILLRSTTMTLPSGGQMWTLVPSSIYFKNNSSARQILMACQSLNSWKESILFPYYNLLKP